LTVEQVVAACRQHDEGRVRRRFEVLRDYRAIAKVNERPNELFHQAAFAPYVMLLFLRRLADGGGQSELHRLLTLEHLSVSADGAQMEDGRATAHRLTTVFRLLEFGVFVDDRNLTEAVEREMLDAEDQLYERVHARTRSRRE
jgi:hypothetical protein